jgi:uncharacterized protein YlbG (UPF0298 family)
MRGIDDIESRMEYLHFVKALDAEFLDYVSSEYKKKNDAAKSRAKTGEIVRRK